MTQQFKPTIEQRLEAINLAIRRTIALQFKTGRELSKGKMITSHLYKTDGTIKKIVPSNGSIWTQKELQKLVGGYLEILRTIDGKWLVINEASKLVEPPLPVNKEATKIYVYGRHDPIVGPAVMVDNRWELDSPEDEEG